MKNFEKRVKKYVKLLKGKRLKTSERLFVCASRNQSGPPPLSPGGGDLVHFRGGKIIKSTVNISYPSGKRGLGWEGRFCEG